MEKNKHLTAIIAALMAVAVAVCLLAIACSDKLTQMFGGTGVNMEYETKLFDTDEVMSVNIKMDEDSWNAMLKNAMSEEYYVCDVTINGKTVKNVAIRPKGNTSLSAIAMDPDSDRFSFKLEFDHFVDGQTCYGLDKLILNNNYADATNMKEAVVYDMYQYLGADASLYNYAEVSVNGEYWGVYLALEGVEESFMLRNYGTQDGELYKPDTMDMGGGKDDSSGPSAGGNGSSGAGMTPPSGNGPKGENVSGATDGDTDGTATSNDDAQDSADAAAPPDDADQDSESDGTSSGDNAGESSGFGPGNMPGGGDFDPNNMPDMDGFDPSTMGGPGAGGMGGPGGGQASANVQSASVTDNSGSSAPNGFDPSAMGDFDPSAMGDFDPSNMPDMGDFDPNNMPDMGDFDPSNMGGPGAPNAPNDSETESESSSSSETTDEGDQSDAEGSSSEKDGSSTAGKPSGGEGGPSGMGGFSMGKGGANLNYTDDDLDSYSTIWESAITGTSKADRRRVVTALKNVNEGTNLETYLDVDNVLKYMAVHTFAVNMDSLSGSMAHNYYLYEYDGQLNIIPWDYNLSFGGMSMGGGKSGTQMVNDPIDTPFQGTNFFDALLEDDEYRARYHEYLQQLVDEYVNGGRFDEVYARIRSQIDGLVETDPTAFYSYDEYETAAQMLYDTVKLRAQSIEGQLEGTIPSTTAGQREDSSSLVDGSDIDVTVMGQFDMGGGSGGFGESSDEEDGDDATEGTDGGSSEEADDGSDASGGDSDTDSSTNTDNRPSMPGGGFSFGDMPEGFDMSNMPEDFDPNNLPEGFDMSNMPDGFDMSNLPEGFDMSSMPSGGPGFAGGQSGGMAKIKNLIVFGLCFVGMVVALVVVKLYKRRKL